MALATDKGFCTNVLNLQVLIVFSNRCGCDECTESRGEDSLRHSRKRINAYRALASPSLIALSSTDPILTAFELSGELKRLAFSEHEFKSEYLVCRGIYPDLKKKNIYIYIYTYSN